MRAVLLAAAVVLAACGGGGSSERLEALRADPLGSYAPGGAEPAKERSTPEDTTLGKPQPARHARWFEIDPAEAERRLEEAVSAGEAAGWRFDRTGDGRTAVGEKQVQGGPASAVITLLGDGAVLPAEVGAPALRIVLQR